MSEHDRPATGTRRVALSGLLIVAYAVAIAVWAASPSTDYVPVGKIDGGTVSQPVACNAIVDSPARDLSEPLPDPAVTFAGDLATAQTATELEYSRAPCESPRSDGQLVLGINLVLIVLAVGAWTWWVVRRRRSAATPHDDAAVTSQVAR